MSAHDVEIKSIEKPDDHSQTRFSERRILRFADGSSVTHYIFKPGWRWDACDIPHVVYVMSGQLAVKMSDGSERVVVAGEAAVVPVDHDMWVVGDSPAELVDFWSAEVGKTFTRPNADEVRRKNERAAPTVD
jgi:quercetin dioxygenase-like cupin family protein